MECGWRGSTPLTVLLKSLNYMVNCESTTPPGSQLAVHHPSNPLVLEQ